MDSGLTELGRLLLIAGIVLAVVGGFLLLGGRIPGLGRLPGDVVFRKGHFTFYLPIVTCVLLSLILTLVLAILRR